MLDSLTQRLTHVIKKLRGEARLTESNIDDAMREVRLALLEADVALPVLKDFIAQIRQQAVGEAVLGSLTPAQALIGVVHRELIQLLGGETRALDLTTQPPAIILLAGLQGSGKTTTAGKLAKLIRQQWRKKVLLASCDVYRPAAIEQLKTLAAQAEVDFFLTRTEQRPLDIAPAVLAYARTHYHDVLIVDTAGRLTVDQPMMEEITALHTALKPIETLFVVDAMQGQDAVNTARSFAAAVPLSGVVLTKLDGDSRGGAALSVKKVTGAPIKFAGVSEKLDGLEVFHPERMAARILGMGDVLSLVEQVHRDADQEAVQKLAHKVKTGKAFDLVDFQGQIAQMRKMGGINAMLDKLPAELAQMAQGHQPDERSVARMDGIINAMTPQERTRPEIIKASRKRRIANGAGASVQEVNRLLKQFEQAQKMMKMMSKGGLQKMLRGMQGILPKLR